MKSTQRSIMMNTDVKSKCQMSKSKYLIDDYPVVGVVTNNKNIFI